MIRPHLGALLAAILLASSCARRDAASSLEFQVVSDSDDEIVLEYVGHDFEARTHTLEGKRYTEILLPGADPLRKAGFPALPSVAKDLAIANQGTYSFTILELESKTLPLGTPLPSLGDIDRTQDPETLVPYPSSFYQSQETFPASVFSLGDPFILRDVRGIKTRFNPFQYDAATGLTRVVTRLKVVLRRTQEALGANEILSPAHPSVDFSPIYATQFANAKSLARHFAPKDFPAPNTLGEIVIIAADQFKEAMLPYVQWKIERGIPTKLVTMSDIGGKRSAEDIYAFLQREYQANHMAHIIIVGDAEFVPPRKGTEGNVLNRPADPTYANLAGNDAYPDAIVSRFSAKTPRDVSIMVQRAIRYERSPDVSDDWMSHHLGVASNERYSDNMPMDWERMRTLQDILRQGDFTRFTEVFDPSARAAAITTAVQQGVGFINYLGHGMLDSWVTSGFSNNDVARLSNHRWPFILSVACVNGAFGSEIGDAFGEAWTKAGTPEKPTGAIAMFASSTSQSWVPPAKGQKRAVELLAQHTRITVGELFFSASIAALEDDSNTAAQTFQSWHLFGDGTALIHTKKPVPLSPNIPNPPVHGAQTFRVEGLPPQALVALTSGSQILASGFTGTDGTFAANINISPDVSATRLTITGHNMMPLQKDFQL